MSDEPRLDPEELIHRQPGDTALTPCADCQAQAKRLAIYAAGGGLLAGIGLGLLLLKALAD